MSLTQLAAGLEPIRGSAIDRLVPSGGLASAGPLEVSATASVLVRVGFEIAGGNTPQADTQIDLLWSVSPDGGLNSVSDRIAVAPGDILTGGEVYIMAPVRGGWLTVFVSLPAIGGSTPVRVRTSVFGFHVPLLGVVWHGELTSPANLPAPAAGAGPLVSISGGSVAADLRSAYPGRTHVSFNVNGHAPAGAEAAATVSILKGPGYAPTSASSYTVPTGKILRLTYARTLLRNNAALASTFRIRLTTSLTGNEILRLTTRLTAAGVIVVEEPIPDGIELAAGTVLQFSWQASAAGTAPTEDDLQLHGFEYSV